MIPSAKVVKKVIIIMWCFLGAYTIIKLLGNDIFRIVVYDQEFINICQMIDNTIIIKYFLALLCCYCSYSLFILAILQKLIYNKRQRIIVIVSLILMTALSLTNNYLSLACDILKFFVLPFILKKDLKISYLLIGNVLNLVFQVISLFIKSMGFNNMADNTLTVLIFSIDVYLMLGLYYLYANLLKKEVT